MEKAKEIIEDVSSDMNVEEYNKEMEILMKLHARDEGRSERNIEIAKTMLDKNYAKQDISDITGLSMEQIDTLNNE